MRLKSVELEMAWPEDIPIRGLRVLVLEKLEHFGEPLRWSINTMSAKKSPLSRALKIEAVVIIP